MMNASLSKLSCLCVFAHPDDEAFRCGGTLALLARSGVRVHILCLTSGQEGSCGNPPTCTPRELGEVRKKELRCSCKALGLERPAILNYPDGALAYIPRAEIEKLIQEQVERIQPQIMITWPLDGLSGHPDHRMASACSTQVFTRTIQMGNEYLKALYYLAVPRSIATELGMNAINSIPDEAVSVEVDVFSIWDQKMVAIDCHRTQLDDSPILKRNDEAREMFLGKEHFIRSQAIASDDILINLYRLMGEQ